MRNETDLSPSGLAHFVRDQLASSLRSRRPYNVNLLMGGVDPITGKPHLYWLDYLAALADVPYAAHGYAQYVYIGPSSSSARRLEGRRTKTFDLGLSTETNVLFADTTVYPSWISTITPTSHSDRESSS